MQRRSMTLYRIPSLKGVPLPYRILLLASLLAFTFTPAFAQGNKPANDAAQVNSSAAIPVYRLDFAISELDGGRRINSRHYIMLVGNRKNAKYRTGSRIPVTVGGDRGFQYIDIGVDIDCWIEEEAQGLQIDSTVMISSIAPETERTRVSASTGNPVIRNVRAEEAAVITPGKPTVLNVLDDVATNHRYEFVVTATKEK